MTADCGLDEAGAIEVASSLEREQVMARVVVNDGFPFPHVQRLAA